MSHTRGTHGPFIICSVSFDFLDLVFFVTVSSQKHNQVKRVKERVSVFTLKRVNLCPTQKDLRTPALPLNYILSRLLSVDLHINNHIKSIPPFVQNKLSKSTVVYELSAYISTTYFSMQASYGFLDANTSHLHILEWRKQHKSRFCFCMFLDFCPTIAYHLW